MRSKFGAFPVTMLSMLTVWTSGYYGVERAVQYADLLVRYLQK